MPSDTKRLDWLEQRQYLVLSIEGEWGVRLETRNYVVKKATLREAIDSLMAVEAMLRTSHPTQKGDPQPKERNAPVDGK